MLSLTACSASRTASSTVRRSTPGVGATGTRRLSPSIRKSGQMRSLAESTFSATSRRAHSALRLRRGRWVRSRRWDGATRAALFIDSSCVPTRPAEARVGEAGLRPWVRLTRTWLGLRAGKSQVFVFRPEDIAVETVDPLTPACGHIEVADRFTDIGRDFVPVELWVFVDQVRRRCVAKLPVQADFLEFVVERIGLPQIMRIAELTNKIRGPQQRGILVDVMVVGR